MRRVWVQEASGAGRWIEVSRALVLYCQCMSIPDVLGPYQILGLLGTGGMSQVYSARKVGEATLMALKVLWGQQVQKSPVFLGRFQREIKTMINLKHPNIVTIFDAGEAGGFYYLAMELMEGESLKERLLKGPLGNAELV